MLRDSVRDATSHAMAALDLGISHAPNASGPESTSITDGQRITSALRPAIMASIQMMQQRPANLILYHAMGVPHLEIRIVSNVFLRQGINSSEKKIQINAQKYAQVGYTLMIAQKIVRTVISPVLVVQLVGT